MTVNLQSSEPDGFMIARASQKIMPAIGCLNRRLYIERKQRGSHEAHGIEDPCVMCPQRSIQCMKPTVYF